ncbi:putative trypsin-like peptidase domain-containing protein [Blattamonas nauphoetae]|uniref:Serine protease n=1 Tax=Blattamonas nauphoetae TaxID=2049346 RepID=A0ABQ9WZS1_9EUKA|nr:putative trypsin-like peptidase domain-containing protein [Blattamonas nauphoetae]
MISFVIFIFSSFHSESRSTQQFDECLNCTSTGKCSPRKTKKSDQLYLSFVNSPLTKRELRDRLKVRRQSNKNPGLCSDTEQFQSQYQPLSGEPLIELLADSLRPNDETSSTKGSKGNIPTTPLDSLLGSSSSKSAKGNRPTFVHVSIPGGENLRGFRPPTLDFSFGLSGSEDNTTSNSTSSTKNKPLHVFLDDDRKELKNSSYPYSAIGLLISPKGICTGTLVDTDIVLTASHCIPWKSDGSIDRIRFLPAYYHKTAPLGYSDVERVFAFTQNSNAIDAMQAAFDYACLKLQKPFGVEMGFFGTTEFDPNWINRTDWTNVGYPQPDTGLKDGVLPFIQDSGHLLSMDSVPIGPLTSHFYTTSFDLTRGHSGGPVYGWFPDEDFPRILAVVSSESHPTEHAPQGQNHLSGGPAMAFLVNYAREYH